MGIWKRMNEITSGKTESKPDEVTNATTVAKPNDTIKGVITNIVKGNEKKNGGYGFITSESLPFERIFFHWSGLHQQTLRFPQLKKRMKVEFQLKHDNYQGYSAIKIKVLD